VARVIIGTLAIEQPTLAAEMCERFPGQIVVSVDARHGQVALKGWREETALDFLQVARQVESYHPAALIFTAIQQDGTLEGPDQSRVRALLATVSLPVLVAGGIGQIAHVQALLRLSQAGLAGMIVGKALYDGSIVFREALDLVQRG
jgi:phosphoribosylformimino-5-aminoimidazole carboxamide ribotide isomerase